MRKLRVSVVHYLNTVPLIWGMLHGKQQDQYELQFTSPAGCADAVRLGKADVGIVPSIEYQRLPHLGAMGGVSIASKAEVKSVLLLSKVPIDKIHKVAVDDSSRTSVALLQVLLLKFYSRAVELQPAAPEPEQMLTCADAALVIGDPALTYRGPAPKVYDLAAEWKKFTGLPFVFALWLGAADLSQYRADFEASRDFGLARVDDIAAQYASRLHLHPAEVKVYLTKHIDYSLDEENTAGLRLFYKLAREIGVVAAEKELRFA